MPPPGAHVNTAAQRKLDPVRRPLPSDRDVRQWCRQQIAQFDVEYLGQRNEGPQPWVSWRARVGLALLELPIGEGRDVSRDGEALLAEALLDAQALQSDTQLSDVPLPGIGGCPGRHLFTVKRIDLDCAHVYMRSSTDTEVCLTADLTQARRGAGMSGGGFVIERRLGRLETLWSRAQARLARFVGRA